MKFKLAFVTAFILIIITSCSQAKKGSEQTPVSEQTQQIPVLPQRARQSSPVNPDQLKPAIAETSEQNSTAVRINPPHGEPYHRCDIPVGAPLNSPPADNTVRPAVNQTQAVSSQNSIAAPNIRNNPTSPTIENARRINPSLTRSTTPANTGTKPRLNPPHGQPWHRCEIAVGSPLP